MEFNRPLNTFYMLFLSDLDQQIKQIFKIVIKILAENI